LPREVQGSSLKELALAINTINKIYKSILKIPSNILLDTKIIKKYLQKYLLKIQQMIFTNQALIHKETDMIY
jgi:hypothetical protein